MAVVGFFIHGGPGETIEDSRATWKFIREVKPHVCGASELSVQPGTMLWRELVGEEDPDSIDGSSPRTISKFPGQHTIESIRARRRGFQRALALSWRHWSRLADVFDLLLHNRAIQRGMLTLMLDFKWMFQLIKGGPKDRDDPRIKRD